MLRLLTDENFRQPILRSLRQRIPELDCVVVQQAGLAGSSDQLLLEVAAREGRVMLSHDINTMTGYVTDRLTKGLQMPGLIIVPHELEIGRAVADLEIMIQCANETDVKDQVRYIPI